MDQLRSTCPSHPEEVRDSRFAFPDRLIRAGWGSVPLHVIEREMERNGGVLPERPPRCYVFDREDCLEETNDESVT
jgi:hypothetical protein